MMATLLKNHTNHAKDSPVDPMLPQTAVIKRIQQETLDTATYSLAFTEPAVVERYRFLPGQFNMLYLPGIGEVAISISSDPGRPETLLHTIRTAYDPRGRQCHRGYRSLEEGRSHWCARAIWQRLAGG